MVKRTRHKGSFVIVAALCGLGVSVARGQCACDCNVNGMGLCTALDLSDVIDCLGMAPVGACATSDVNCDGVIDDIDTAAVACGVRGYPAGACCNPPFGTAVNYQGHLAFAGVPVTDMCDFEFTLWDGPGGAAMPIGSVLARTLDVVDGVFSTDLDFGWFAMDGWQRWLEIAVVCPAGGGPLVTLSPRTELTPAPYAIRAGTGIGNEFGVNLTSDSFVGIGTADPMYKLDVVGDIHTDGSILAGRPDITAYFNRTMTDGVIVALQQDGVTEGTITVAGAVVAYTAFTGAHLGWTDSPIERGSLVTLTGVNRRLHDRQDAELVYGIAPASTPNDPACLGAYLGLQEPGKAASADNPHLVMAVGNGTMWVVDSGKNIAPGEFLISSDVAGHASLDDPQRFAVGNVVARAAESVDWSEVSDTVGGRKHREISVFFESFERTRGVELTQTMNEQRSRMDELERRVASAEARGSRSSLALMGILGAGFGAAALGRRARRFANGGAQ